MMLPSRATPRGRYALANPCPFRELHPAILMVQSAQNIARNDAPMALNGAVVRCGKNDRAHVVFEQVYSVLSLAADASWRRGNRASKRRQ